MKYKRDFTHLASFEDGIWVGARGNCREGADPAKNCKDPGSGFFLRVLSIEARLPDVDW